MPGKENIVKGTFILICANAVSKILGAVFKIPLTFILKESGMAVFTTAFSVYSTFLSFVISGFPVAVSNLCAKHKALGNFAYIKRVVFVSSAMLSFLGILASAVMFFGGDFFALAMKEPKAALAAKAIAPAIFFVALGTAFKGYFQGMCNMIPTAVSQVSESFLRLFAGFAFAFYLFPKGHEYSAAGAIFGITLGEIFASAFLYIAYIASEKHLPAGGCNFSKKQAAEEILSVVVPMFIFSAIINAMSITDTAVVRNMLLNVKFTSSSLDRFLKTYPGGEAYFGNVRKTMSLDLASAGWLYGAYSGYALTLFHLPVGIVSAVGVGIMPAVTSAVATSSFEKLQKTFSTALKLTSVITFPFALGILFFGEDVLMLIFKNNTSSKMLALLSPCMVFFCMQQLFTAILHSSGHITSPYIITFLGIVVKIVFCLILIPIPELNICGAPISSGIAYFVIMILCGIEVRKKTGVKFNFLHCILKPFVCAFFTIGFMMFLKFYLQSIILNTSLCFLATFFGGGIVYILLILTVCPINVEK